MGRHYINTLVTIACVCAASGILGVNGYSPAVVTRLGAKSQHFHPGRSTALNLSVPDKGPKKSSPSPLSKRGTKSAPSIAEVQERFNWKLPSVTPQEDQPPSPPTPTINPDNTLRNAGALATAAIVLGGSLYASQSIPNLTSSLTLLSDKIASTGFYQAFSLVFVSEIGDKTFFIAGLLAMKTGKLLSFVGSISALAAMTVLSVVIGQLFHAVPVELTQGLPIDDYAAVLAFTFFGVKTLIEAYECDEDDGCTVDSELAGAEEAVEGSTMTGQATAWAKIVSTFGLVFAAEFGDRSFLSTIALSAAQNPVSVAAGSIVAHALATGIAVTGGSYVAKYISERTIGFIGGSLFIVFAVTTAIGLF